MQVAQTILWRRLDVPGHDACRLDTVEGGWRLAGTAVSSLDGRPCHLSYAVDCDATWHTRSARVRGWLGRQDVEVVILAAPDGRWEITGAEPTAVEGCVDVDLGFTPATNLLPLRRLALAVGESADAPAAWLSFPNLTLERLEQRYRRLAPTRYEYQASGGRYVANLEVDDVGFVTRYPGLWEMQARA